MEIRLYIGPHFTGQEHLRSQLEANAEVLAEAGSLIPSVETAQQAMSVMLKAARKGQTNEQTGANFLSHLTDDQECKRVLIIDPHVAGSLMEPTDNGQLFSKAHQTVQLIAREVKNVADLHICMATRNPASLLPTYFTTGLRFQPQVTFESFVSESDPHQLRWSETLHRMQGKGAWLPVTTWAYEDYPFIWREVAQAFSGIPNKEDLIDCGAQDIPEMTLKGGILMQEYLTRHPAQNPKEYVKVRERFLDTFPSVGLPAHPEFWPKELVDDLTNAYEDDLYYIDRMDNLVTVRQESYA